MVNDGLAPLVLRQFARQLVPSLGWSKGHGVGMVNDPECASCPNRVETRAALGCLGGPLGTKLSADGRAYATGRGNEIPGIPRGQ